MPGSFIGPILLAAAMVTPAPKTKDLPIRLISEPVSGGVRLKVVGESEDPLQARYSLEVTSGAPGSNRSVQRGVARLKPGVAATLVTLTLGDADHWSAQLEVSPEHGKPYELRESSSSPVGDR